MRRIKSIPKVVRRAAPLNMATRKPGADDVEAAIADSRTRARLTLEIAKFFALAIGATLGAIVLGSGYLLQADVVLTAQSTGHLVGAVKRLIQAVGCTFLSMITVALTEALVTHWRFRHDHRTLGLRTDAVIEALHWIAIWALLASTVLAGLAIPLLGGFFYLLGS